MTTTPLALRRLCAAALAWGLLLGATPVVGPADAAARKVKADKADKVDKKVKFTANGRRN